MICKWQTVPFFLAGLTFLLTARTEACVRDGIYLGTGIGSSFGHAKLTATNTETKEWVKKHAHEDELIGNAFLGYGYTAQSSFYLGTEVGTSFPRRSIEVYRPGVVVGDSYTLKDSVRFHDYATGDVLAGFRICPNWVFYARGGVAYSNLSLYQHPNTLAGTAHFHASEKRWGGRAGAGMNWGITRNVGLGLDYVYTAYQKMKAYWPTHGVQFKTAVHSHFVGLSLIYSFPLSKKCRSQNAR